MTESILGPRARPRAASRSIARPAISMPLAITVGVAVLGFAWMLVLLLRRADGLATPAYDQAFFQQVVWNASQGRGFVSNFSGGSFLGLHFSPMLAIPALVETIWADARVLTVFHVTAIAAAGPAAFVFLRAAFRPSRLAPWLAAAIAAPIPLWSAMQEAGRADFHTESLALPIALLAAWAAVTGRTKLMLLLAAVVLLAKEDQGFTVFVIGALAASRGAGAPRRSPIRRAGLAMMGFSVAWTLLLIGIIMPALRDGARLATDWYYGWILEGGGPIANVGRAVEQLTAVEGWMAAGGLVLSGAALGLLRPAWLLLMLPPVALSLLSGNPAQADLKLHYTLLPIIPLVIATALGGRRLLAFIGRRRRRVGTRRRLRVAGPMLLAFAVPALAVAWFGGGLPPTARTARGQWDLPPAREQLLAFAAQVPDDVALTMDDGAAVALASRRSLHLISNRDPAAWVLVDRRAHVPGYQSRTRRDAFLADLPGSGRELIATDGRFELWGPVDD